MALTKLTDDLNIIANLDDEPNDAGGLTAAAFKEKFDSAGNSIKTFLNDTMIPEIEAQKATKEEVQSVVLGQIPDGSLTASKMVSDIAINPTAHKSTHAIGGSDPLKSTDLGLDTTTAAKYFASVVGNETVDQALSLLGGGNLRRYIVNSSTDLDTLLLTLLTAQENYSKKSYVVSLNTSFAPFYGSTWFLTVNRTASTYGIFEMIADANAPGMLAFCRTLENNVLTDWAKDLNAGNGGAQISIGSYTGTGTYGSSNKNHVVSNFKIKLAIVGSGDSGQIIIWQKGVTSTSLGFYNDSNYAIFASLSADELTLSWYNLISAFNQLNTSGQVYPYVLVG